MLGLTIFTNWAYPVLASGGSGGVGSISVPKMEAGVWVEFEAGCLDRPIYVGGWASQPGDVSEIPDLAKGIADESALPPKGTDSAHMADGMVAHEPPAPFAAVYPNNAVLKTKAGIVQEMDSTTGAVRIHLWHPAGSWLEFHPDGSIVMKADEDHYVIVKGDSTLHVTGDWNVKVEGTARITVTGDAKLDSVSGNVEIDAGNEIRLAGGGPPVARLGDTVVVTGGSSAGTYPIVRGSVKVKCG